MKNEDLAKFALLAIIIFVIYYIFTDMNDRRELEKVSREMNKATKEFSKAMNEDFKTKEETIQKIIVPMISDKKTKENIKIEIN